MVLIIDNYDSFVFNLARYVQEAGFKTTVLRHDAISLAEIKTLSPSHIIISPGPYGPEQTGICPAMIKCLAPFIPILGVCLGHQTIAHVYGGKIIRANYPMHGRASIITHNEQAIFTKIQNPLTVGRYHSLLVSDDNFPAELEIMAQTIDGEIMALRHRRYPSYGVQFHPESILTEQGHQLLNNFLIQHAK